MGKFLEAIGTLFFCFVVACIRIIFTEVYKVGKIHKYHNTDKENILIEYISSEIEWEVERHTGIDIEFNTINNPNLKGKTIGTHSASTKEIEIDVEKHRSERDGILPFSYVEETIAHEIGHALRYKLEPWQREERERLFNLSDKTTHTEDIPEEYYWNRHHCSNYGMKNVYEDFAECFESYIVNDYRRGYPSRDHRTIKERYEMLSDIFDQNECYLDYNKNDIWRRK